MPSWSPLSSARTASLSTQARDSTLTSKIDSWIQLCTTRSWPRRRGWWSTWWSREPARTWRMLRGCVRLILRSLRKFLIYFRKDKSHRIWQSWRRKRRRCLLKMSLLLSKSLLRMPSLSSATSSNKDCKWEIRKCIRLNINWMWKMQMPPLLPPPCNSAT